MYKLSFVYLSAFSTNGGIEKFNRAFMKAASGSFKNFRSYSLYDQERYLDEKYLAKEQFVAATGFKIVTFFKILLTLIFSQTSILIYGHINLAALALPIKKIRPKKKLVLIIHGIEVWAELSKTKLKFLQLADEIWAVSSYTKQRLVEGKGISADKIKIFPNTIDPYFQAPKNFEKPKYLLKRYGIQNQDKVLFTLCRLSSLEAYKGYDRVVEAMPVVNQKVGNVKYLIAGKYDEEEKARAEKIAKNNGVEGQLIFTGFLKEEEIRDHFLLGDVFVMPSRNEGFGIVYLEAMLCGLPVIAGNKDGSVDALKHGELGTLVDPGEIEGIADAIVENLEKAANMDELAKKELQRKVMESFGFDQFRSRLKELLSG